MDYNYLEEKCISLLLLTQGQELTLHQRGDAKQELDNLLNKLHENDVYKPMTEFPLQAEGEDFSKTVLVFDKDLEYFDFGFYNFDTKKWDVMGGFQMDLICWKEIKTPMYKDVQKYPTLLTD